MWIFFSAFIFVVDFFFFHRNRTMAEINTLVVRASILRFVHKSSIGWQYDFTFAMFFLRSIAKIQNTHHHHQSVCVVFLFLFSSLNSWIFTRKEKNKFRFLIYLLQTKKKFTKNRFIINSFTSIHHTLCFDFWENYRFALDSSNFIAQLFPKNRPEMGKTIFVTQLHIISPSFSHHFFFFLIVYFCLQRFAFLFLFCVHWQNHSFSHCSHIISTAWLIYRECWCWRYDILLANFFHFSLFCVWVLCVIYLKMVISYLLQTILDRNQKFNAKLVITKKKICLFLSVSKSSSSS